MFKKVLIIITLCILPWVVYAAPDQKAESLLLAQEFRDQNIIGWAMSEKLDGVRGFWDGQHLITRGGYYFDAPEAFLRDFPPFAVDGELFIGRGRFHEVSAKVRRRGDAWQDVYLHVFDVPEASGHLYQRLEKIQQWVDQHPQVRIKVIQQQPVTSLGEAQAFLRQVESLGGEGVVFRRPEAAYTAGRSGDMLKYKSQHDDECVVIEHHQGQGKYRHVMGSITCENQHGRFRIGSGFSDNDRAYPPAIGSVITYRYRGFTHKGLPRFATYWRPYQP